MSILKPLMLFVSGMALTGLIGELGRGEGDVAMEPVDVVRQETNAASCLAKETLLKRIGFAGESRTGRLLREPDAFTAQAGVFDRGARMRTLEPTTTLDFLDFLSGHGLAWTPEEKAYWSGIAEEVSAALAGLSLVVPRVFLAKTTGLEEFNAVYTRHNTIFFPRERLTLAGTNRRWDRHLFAHELFHISVSTTRPRGMPSMRFSVLSLLRACNTPRNLRGAKSPIPMVPATLTGTL